MKFLIVMVLAIMATQALSDETPDNSTANTGNELVSYCSSSHQQQNDENWTICVALVNGIVQGLGAGAQRAVYFSSPLANDKKHSPKEISDFSFEMAEQILGFCTLDNATRGQIALVVTKYLEKHPELLNKSIPYLIMSALADAWPCNKKN